MILETLCLEPAGWPAGSRDDVYEGECGVPLPEEGE